jgi:chlorobactene glucosyltransferase
MEMSVLLLGGYFGLLSLVWGGLILGTQRWGERWRMDRPPLGQDSKNPLLVSICIPARNEEENIGACLSAALGSRWPQLEVIVVDDRSTDETSRRARAAGEGDDRLFIVEGTEPPSGWAGKPWACRRAAGEARGQILCFVDADVRLAPDTVTALVDTMVGQDLRLLSAYGSWDLRSFWERVLIPAVGWLIRGAVDLDQVNDPGLPVAFANGQLIAVERSTYDAMGGHGTVRSEVLEDVRLAEQFKCRGHKVGMRVAPWAFQVRLYESLSEIIRGYTKNMYEGMGRRPSLALGAILFIFVGALLPWILLLTGTGVRVLLGWAVPETPWLLWCAVVCGLQLLFRWRLESKDGRSGWMAFAHPLANILLSWILFRSMFAMETTWKGRVFVDGKAADPKKNADP